MTTARRHVVRLLTGLLVLFCLLTPQLGQAATKKKAKKKTAVAQQVEAAYRNASWSIAKLRRHKKLRGAVAGVQLRISAVKRTIEQLSALAKRGVRNKAAAARLIKKAKRQQQDLDEIRRKRQEMIEEALDKEIDKAKKNYKDAKKKFKRALRILSEALERQTQTVQKITS